MTHPTPEALRKLVAEATPGPWLANRDVIWHEGVEDTRRPMCCNRPLANGDCCGNPVMGGYYGPTQERHASASPNDAALIVALVNAAPLLIDALERAQPLLDASERVEEQTKALRQAAEWFRTYEVEHLAKDTPEGRVKAQRNADRAEFCADAAGPLAPQPQPPGAPEGGWRQALMLIAATRPGREDDDEHMRWYNSLTDTEREIADRSEAYTYSRAWCAASDHAVAALATPTGTPS